MSRRDAAIAACQLVGSLVFAVCLSLLPADARAEPITYSLKAFGHIDLQESFSGRELGKNPATLGESALFGYIAPTPRLSMTTEISYLPKRYRDKTLKVERFLLRYEMSEKFSLSVGKMHTPVNYWNDTFHHGRLMFPTVDRPRSFSRFIPIHETGLRVAGRELGNYNFLFDLVVSSGQQSEGELFAEGVRSFTARFGARPISGLDLQVAHYAQLGNDDVFNYDAADYSGSRLRTESHRLTGLSVYWQGSLITSLTEFAFVRFRHSDERSLGLFQYAGLNLNDGLRTYLYADYLDVEAGLFLEADRTEFRTGLGAAWRVSSMADVKLQLEWLDERRLDVESSGLALKIQLAFGF